MNPRRPHLWLALILLLALGLRISLMFHEGLWLDEFFTLELSSGRGLADWHLPRGQIIAHPPDLTVLSNAPPWWKIPSHLSQDPHPPIFYILLRFWRDLFGDGRAALRSLPLLFSLISIVLIYQIGRIKHDPLVGLFAALMLALAAPQTMYSVETRNYSMMVLAVLIAVIALLGVERRGAHWRYIGFFGLATLTALFTHYFTIFVLIGLVLWSFYGLTAKTARRVAAAALVAFIIFSVLWMPMVIRQASTIHRVNSVPGSQATTSNPATAAARAVLLPARQIIPSIPPSPALAILAAIVYILLWLLLRRRRDLSIYIFWVVPTIVVLFILDAGFSGQFALIRYTLAIGPAVFLLLAAMPINLPHKSRIALSLIGPILCACFLWTAFRPWKGDWPQMAQYISTHAKPNDPLVFIDRNKDVFNGYRYVGLRYYTPHWQHPILLLGTITSPAFGEQLPRHRRIWVVSNLSSHDVKNLFSDYHLGSDQKAFAVGDITELIRSATGH